MIGESLRVKDASTGAEYECAIRDFTPHPFLEGPPLVVEAWCPELAGVAEDLPLVLEERRWRQHAVVRAGGWVLVRHRADGSGEGQRPVVYATTEHFGSRLCERHHIEDLAPTGEWDAQDGPVRVIPRGRLGAGMTVLQHAGFANPFALAKAEGGSWAEQQERAHALARDILYRLGYRARDASS